MIKTKEAEDILKSLQHLHELWISVRRYVYMSFGEEPISGDSEQKFLEVKSSTTKFLRTLAEKIDPHQFQYDPQKITAFLRQAISITHLRSLPEADRKTLLVLWHEVYIHLSQVVGAFVFIKDGYQPSKKVKRSTSIASLKGRGGSKKKKKNYGKALVTIIMLAVAAGAIYWAMNR